MEALQQMKPSMLMNMIYMIKFQELVYCSPGIEVYYFSKTAEKHIEWAYLETIETRIDLLTNIGNGYEDEYVKYSLNELKNAKKSLNSLISKWRNGNTKTFSKVLNKEKKKFPSVYNQMYKERTYNWLPQIEEMLNDTTTEILFVGYIHLIGEDGLLQLLQDKGYKIEQLK